MSTLTRYVKKPIEIEAMHLVGTAREIACVTDWMQANLYVWLTGNALEPDTLRYPDQIPEDNSKPDKGIWIDPATGDLMIRTSERDTRASYGDWIIRGVQNEFYPCKSDIFEATYERVDDDERTDSVSEVRGDEAP